MLMYLREAADEARGAAGGPVQAVVEEQSVTDGHVLQSEVELSHDAGPQVGAATGELHVWGGAGGGASVSFHEVIGGNPEASSYNIDERRQKDDDDGEDAHQGAVEPRLDDPFGKSLQGGWEELGTWGGGGPAGRRTGRRGS